MTTRRRSILLAAPLAAGVLLSASTGPPAGPAAPAPAQLPTASPLAARAGCWDWPGA